MVLSVCRTSLDSPALMLRLIPVDVAGDYLKRLEMRVSGAAIAPDTEGSVLSLNLGGSCSDSNVALDGQVAEPGFNVGQCPHFHCLPSVVSVSTPQWVEPLASFLDFKRMHFSQHL